MASTVLFRNIEYLFFRFGSLFHLALDYALLCYFFTLIAVLLPLPPADDVTLL